MPRAGLTRRARRLVGNTLRAQQLLRVRLAVRRLPAAPAIVCWDLDNTLVGTGTLLSAGTRLEQAVAAAEPMPGMLAFVEAVRARLPGAAHVVLSVRTRAMRAETLTWLARHRVGFAPEVVFFVPFAASKPRIWRALARRGPLLVVDDLSHGHEGDVRPYDDLVAQARAIGAAYVGLDDIAAIGRDPGAGAALAERLALSAGR
jgi:hypothetical protein